MWKRVWVLRVITPRVPPADISASAGSTPKVRVLPRRCLHAAWPGDVLERVAPRRVPTLVDLTLVDLTLVDLTSVRSTNVRSTGVDIAHSP